MTNQVNTQQSMRAAAQPARSTQPRPGTTRTPSRNLQSAQKNYERYLILAEAKAQAGDRIEAENYYQHAEHYLRSMSANS